MESENVIPFQPRQKPEAIAKRPTASLTEADMRWLVAACHEFGRLTYQAGEETAIGEHLRRAHLAAMEATVGIADITGVG